MFFVTFGQELTKRSALCDDNIYVYTGKPLTYNRSVQWSSQRIWPSFHNERNRVIVGEYYIKLAIFVEASTQTGPKYTGVFSLGVTLGWVMWVAITLKKGQ